MESGFDAEAGREDRSSEIDIRVLWAALIRRRAFIILPVCAAFFVTSLIVSLITSRYTAESQVLLENQENYFTRPQKDQVVNDGPSIVDPEAVGSQIQLITSRDLARRAIKALNLEGNSEFDPLAKGIGPISRVLILLGVVKDPTRLSPEDRILETFQQRLSVYSPTKTRVLTIDFQSRDPELAARAANKIAELYLNEQSGAKRARAKAAAASLESLITELRGKLTDASTKVEEFRSSSGLLTGSNNMTLTGQQLADINTELSRARTSQADAQAKASLIRDMIKQRRVADVPDVANNDLVRRIAEQRVTARAQLASESRTLLPGHPRIKELMAQIADLDSALRGAADQTVHALENESRIAGNRVANLESVLNQQKKVAGVANSDEVHLRELERTADAYKDELESSTAKYQEALAREDSPATPADARIISRAIAPNEPSYPKKVPLIVFATLAALLGTSGWIVSGELLSGRANAARSRPVPLPRDPMAAARVFTRAAASANTSSPDRLGDSAALTAASLAGEIVNKQKDGESLCIMITALTRQDIGTGIEIALGRELARTGHSIIIDLDGHPDNFESLIAAWRGKGETNKNAAGLSDLLGGEASFAEVIHRDEASRLHFIQAGREGDFDISEFELVLEALSQNYDFILLMAPPLERNETALGLAGHADIVIVDPGLTLNDRATEIKRDFIEFGAREVILLNAPPEVTAGRERQDVA